MHIFFHYIQIKWRDYFSAIEYTKEKKSDTENISENIYENMSFHTGTVLKPDITLL